MDTQIVAIYCLCDDILKGLHHHEDDQCRMSDAKVMTTSIVAATFFAGNMEKSRCFLNEHRYILNMLGKSRFNRRQHWIAELFLIPAWMTYLLACYRKVIETAGSLIEKLLPKHIHAVTARELPYLFWLLPSTTS